MTENFPEYVQENVPLAPLTTMGVGGSSRYFASIKDTNRLVEVLNIAARSGLKTYIIGQGSNLLVADTGFDGLVIKPENRQIEHLSKAEDFAIFRVGAGLPWDEFVAYAVAQKHTGIACMSGIPGMVGACPIQNIGAYGQEVAGIIHKVHVLDRTNYKNLVFKKGECGFAYRMSNFKTCWQNKYVITAVEFQMPFAHEETIRYPELKKRLGIQEGSAIPPLTEIREMVLSIRREKSMIYSTSDPNSISAGSFFVNPVVPIRVAENIEKKLRLENFPSYPAGDGKVKLSTAFLIENAGFAKGYIRGNAGLSAKHVLAIINRGGAKTSDILDLATEICATVRDKFGVRLVLEPNMLGFKNVEKNWPVLFA
ncbi:UDP-N-acetylmuramate dehydrogenase [Candidatus Riflebacteria bacterium]